MEILNRIQELLAILSKDEGAYCYVTLFEDGTGSVMKEENPDDRFLLDFDTVEDIIPNIEQYLAGYGLTD